MSVASHHSTRCNLYQLTHCFLTDAAVLLVGTQVTYILKFFLARNIRIARERAWAQTMTSRGKGPDFWQPYVEEWDVPPVVVVDTKDRFIKKWLGGWVGMFTIRRGSYFHQT